MNHSERSEKAMDISRRYRGEADGRLKDPPGSVAMREIFPEHLKITEEYLLADVMSRPGLTMREHSMIIIATLVVVRFEGGLKGHMNWALNVGISREEMVEIIMHVGQRTGWPVGIELFKLIEDAYPGYLAEIKDTPLKCIPLGQRLSSKEHCLLTITVYATGRFGDRLEGEIQHALKTGISEETILEVIMQITPFAGWPAGVQALRSAKNVFSSKRTEGISFTRAPDRGQCTRSSEREEMGRKIIQKLQNKADEENLFGFIGEVCPDFLRVITEGHLFGEVWSRPGLGLRDRTMITLAVLIAFRCSDELKAHIGYARNAGISKKEIQEVALHVANYTCWGHGNSIAKVAEEVFSRKE
jgi:4-carboxymuconolactone decarboxylase